jgi:hypothetical protein
LKDPYIGTSILKRIEYLRARTNRVAEVHRDLRIAMSEVEPIDPIGNSAPTTIKKRSAPFGFIGSLSRSLFGTLSDEDGQYYSKQIALLNKGQTALANLAKENLYVVQHKIHGLEQEIVNSHVALNKTMNLLKNTIRISNDLSSLWHHIEFTRDGISVLNEIESRLDLYQEIYHTLSDIVYAARLGHLHPSMITTSRLQQIIRQIEDLHPQYEFPIPITHARADKLTQVADVHLGHKDGHFLVEISIPLLDKFHTELYKMHPLPIPQYANNLTASAYIIPQTTYIALSHDKRSYSFLNNKQLDKCKHVPHVHICTNDQPIYDAGENMACEYRLLNQPSKDALRQCNLHMSTNVLPTWIHLDSIDSWLYSIPKPTTVQILCPGEQHELKLLNGIGILQLKPRCSARQGHVTLPGMTTLGTTVEFLYLPNIHLNITSIDSDALLKFQTLSPNLPSIKPLQIGPDSGLPFETLRQKYDEILKQQKGDLKDSYVIYSSAGIGVFVLMALILITGICANHYLCVKRGRGDEESHSYDFSPMHPIDKVLHPTVARQQMPSFEQIHTNNAPTAPLAESSSDTESESN